MKIIDNRVEAKGVPFNTIFPGEIFEWSHGLYMGIVPVSEPDGAPMVNAISIENGVSTFFNGMTRVVPVETELTIIANQ